MTNLVSQSPVWQELLVHASSIRRQSLAELVMGQVDRQAHWSFALEGLTLNAALQRVTDETMRLLVKLAEQQDVARQRDRMFSGDVMNASEHRAVLHTALRRSSSAPLRVDGRDVMPDIAATKKRIGDFVACVRDGEWRGATGKPIRHVVNIGIGGSDLGPRVVVEALNAYASKLTTHFVANVDAYELLTLLKSLPAEETLFVVVSKTFTTQETLMNAQTARQWLVDKLGTAAVAQHFVAVSTNKAAVESFGIHQTNIFPLWDWVGGRFSVWSAVGLSVALALGMEHFSALLDGAAAMDAHFCSVPLSQNLPVILALLGLWNRNFLGASSLAILPYAERLRNFPRFLRQLEMESNGKSVTKDGQWVDYGTAPVIFGDCGTVGQHSFHQCLHQGTDIIPVDFIAVAQDDLGQPAHHQALLSNMVAQAGAFAFGRTEAATPQEIYPGNRPSTIIRLDALTPRNLGLLLALYEHKTFVQGVIWGLNSFDQPGVELGKVMAKKLDQPQAGTDPGSQFMAELLCWSCER